MDPGFQYALLASSIIDVKAPPIDIALDPTPMPKNWAAVVPTLDCEENPIAKNIIYKYGTVRFGDQENDNGMLSCKFDYEILENPNNVEKEQDFDLLLGDIMVDILDKQITTGFHMGGVSLSGTSFQEEGSTYYRTSGEDILDNGVEKMAENMMYNIDDYRKKEED